MKKYKTIDLFAGIGGIRRGFELTGHFENVLSAEIDKYACRTYEHLYGENPLNDITSDEFKDKVRQVEYDILLGGFPCQAFSIAGKKEGFEDKTRGTLFFDIAKILKETKPKSILLENVEGLLRHDKGNTFQIICETLDELGYKIVGVEKDQEGNYLTSSQKIVRTPVTFGIPQKRSRVFIMAFRKDLIPVNYVFPSLPEDSEEVIYKDLNYLIEKKVHPKYYLSQKLLETLNAHKSRHQSKKSGFGYVVVNDADNPVANTIMATGGSGKERNIIRQYYPEYDGLELNINRKGRLNSEGLRNMTPTEWGKLQGFINYGFLNDNVDTFSFPEKISDTQQYKLFGNSVCIPVIKAMGKYMYERFNDFYGNE